MAAGSSTVATLVLALQARNETRTAFAAVQRDLQQQTEAARRAAAEQTLAVRQATQQQLLEIRQRTAAEALALRQSVAGQALATRQAMEQRIQMLRQDAEQTALLAREGARAQIAAIHLTRDADIRAARERALAATQMLRTQEEAARIAAAHEAASAREARGGGVVGLMERVPGGGLLESMGRFGAQMVLWNVGYAAINRMTEAIGGFASGLVTANAFMENFHQTMAAIYHSDTAATQASDWLTQFALKSPDTREHVFSAAEELAPLGVNLKEVMPAIGNVSAIMNVDETRGAQAFADAFEGRFVMMQQTLHITKGELVKFGMEIDHNGHVLNNSFVPAFERLARARYGEGMAKQMQTVSGVFSNVHDAIENLQRIMGKPMFDLIRHDLQGFMDLLMSPQAMGAAHMFGVGLGNAFHAMSNAVRAAGPIVLGAIGFIIGAWNAAAPAIQNAVAFINGVVQRVGAFLHDTVLPLIFQGLAAASTWWQQHAEQVRAVAQAILGALQTYWGILGANMKGAFDILHGIWLVGWGLLGGVVGMALDLITRNWTAFGKDLSDMSTQLASGIVHIFLGLITQTITLTSHLADPINAIMHGIYNLSRYTAGLVFDIFNDLPTLIMQSIDRVLKALPAVGKQLAAWAGNLGTMLRDAIMGLHPHKGASGFGGLGGFGAAAARDTRTVRQQVIDDMTVGWAPDTNLVFNVDAAQAIKDAEARADAITRDLQGKPNPWTGKVTHYGDQTLQDTTAGKNIWDDWMAKLKALQASGLKLPGLDWGKGGTPPGTGVDWSGGGGGEPFDPRSANSAQQKLIADAQTRFQLHLAQGGITQAQGLRDINAILAADKAGGATHDQLLLTALQDTKTLDEQLLGQVQKQYDFDSGVAHPNRQKLHQDELAYLRIMAQTPGVTPLDVATVRQQWDARIDQLTGTKSRDRADDALKQFKWDAGLAHPALATLKRDEAAYLALYAKQAGITPLDVKLMRRDLDRQIEQAVHGAKAPAAVAPYKQAAMALAAGAGYGQTTVTMGPVRDQLIAQLQAQLRELKAQNAGQQKTIAALEAQLVELHRASGLLDGIFHNTAGTHQATQQTARQTQPRPTGGAHGFSQRTGMPVPV